MFVHAGSSGLRNSSICQQHNQTLQLGELGFVSLFFCSSRIQVIQRTFGFKYKCSYYTPPRNVATTAIGSRRLSMLYSLKNIQRRANRVGIGEETMAMHSALCPTRPMEIFWSGEGKTLGNMHGLMHNKIGFRSIVGL